LVIIDELFLVTQNNNTHEIEKSNFIYTAVFFSFFF